LQMVMDQADSFDFIHFHTDYLNFPFSQNNFPHLTTLHGKLDIPELKPLYKQFSDQPVVSISNAQQTALTEANFIGTVHHGLPDQLLTPGKGKGNYFAFLGRISPEKRCDRAIEIAIAANTPLRIAAKVDKADEKYFEQKIKPLMEHPLIEYIGEINDEDKQEFLGEAIALLFPIDWPEPFGLVMIEAMACGTPVVAWNRGSVPEVMEHGKNGFIVNSMDEAIQAAIHSRDLDRKQVRQSFDNRFTARRMAGNYLDLYQRLINEHKTREAFESKSLSIGFRNKDLTNKMII
jgi:glycosyltransferase involved in cell wall biosynthesis